MHEDSQVYGVSEACKYNDHTVCRARNCRCSCHALARAEAEQYQVAAVASPSTPAAVVTGAMVCPQCGAKRPPNEQYCRVDGSRLLSLICRGCRHIFTPGDKFCWYCGNDLTAIEATVAEVAAAERRDAEIEAEATEMERIAKEAMDSEELSATPRQRLGTSRLPVGAIKT